MARVGEGGESSRPMGFRLFAFIKIVTRYGEIAIDVTFTCGGTTTLRWGVEKLIAGSRRVVGIITRGRARINCWKGGGGGGEDDSPLLLVLCLLFLSSSGFSLRVLLPRHVTANRSGNHRRERVGRQGMNSSGAREGKG